MRQSLGESIVIMQSSLPKIPRMGTWIRSTFRSDQQCDKWSPSNLTIKSYIPKHKLKGWRMYLYLIRPVVLQGKGQKLSKLWGLQCLLGRLLWPLPLCFESCLTKSVRKVPACKGHSAAARCVVALQQNGMIGMVAVLQHNQKERVQLFYVAGFQARAHQEMACWSSSSRPCRRVTLNARTK